MPRTLLARTFFLLALLVLLTTAAWIVFFRYMEAEPRAREIAQLGASAVNLVRASIYAAAPEKRPGLFNEFSTREGIRLLPAEPNDNIEGNPDSSFQRLIEKELKTRLGPSTRMATRVNGATGFWISFKLDEQDNDEYWLVLPRDRANRSFHKQWLAWGLVALALALVIAWLIASRISRPLKAMAKSAESVGRGQIPAPLQTTGAEELKQLASAFNTMAKDLEMHANERAQVLAGISHDLRTPLTRLRLEAEMSVHDELARQAVVADIEQMEAIISQFMDYARTDEGEAPEKTDLITLLETIAARQTHIGHPVKLDIFALPEIMVRPKAISRAVTNLIDNAWKYGSENIVLHASNAGSEIHIEVRDKGPGIPISEIERLKRPFTRFESARSNATGTGLGLAIVERTAQIHMGKLELLPNPGGGLNARLCLPIN